MNSRKIVNSLLFLCLILSILAIGFYINFFHHLTLSQKTSDWSNFGSYMAGTLGPLLSLVSILFIIKSINFTNENHEKVMTFTMQDKIHNQIKDMGDVLKNSITSNFIFQESTMPNHRPYSEIICSRVRQLMPIRDEMAVLDVAVSAVREAHNNFKSEIHIILKLISLLNTLSPEDKDIYIILLEVKLTQTERAVLYCFTCKDFPDFVNHIDREWPSFRGEIFNSDRIPC